MQWNELRELLITANSVLHLAFGLRGVLLRAVWRIRVADTFGFVTFVIFVCAGLLYPVLAIGPWGLFFTALGCLAGVLWARSGSRVVRAAEQGADDEILGFFFFQRKNVPVGVHNWLS